MNFQFGWTAIGVIISILLHAFFTVWWASKMTFQMQALCDGLNRLDKELEKRDRQIAAAWIKIDSLGDRVTRIESERA